GGVSVQLGECLKQELAPVAGMRALGMAGKLRALPRCEARVRALPLPLEPFLQPCDFVGLRRVVGGLQRRDTDLELEKRLLEVETVRPSRSSGSRGPAAFRPRS